MDQISRSQNNNMNLFSSKNLPNVWACIKFIQIGENRLDTLRWRYRNSEVNAEELLDPSYFVVVQSLYCKKTKWTMTWLHRFSTVESSMLNCRGTANCEAKFLLYQIKAFPRYHNLQRSFSYFTLTSIISFGYFPVRDSCVRHFSSTVSCKI